MNRWKEKNIGYLGRKGTSEKKRVINEDDGSTAGYHVEHWDDHQDAIATPKTVKARIKVNQGD